MRFLRYTIIAVAFGAMLASGPVAAATEAYTDPIAGYEVWATSTQGTFVGSASGGLPGYWKAVVDHTPLAPNATIGGGEFYLATSYQGAPAVVTGDFTSGTITLMGATSTCGNQVYAVDAFLGEVGVGADGIGTGRFSGTLTHYRTLLFGRCVTYAARVAGSLTLAF